jgi:hypothetical protein
MSFNIEEGRTYDTLENAEKAVQAEAKRAGFALARRSSNLKGADKTRARFVKLICTKGEHYTSHQDADNTSKKRKRQSMKKGCRFSLRIVDISGSWTVKKIINQHNHDMVETKDMYTLPDHRKLSSEQENAVAFSLGANSDALSLLHTINNMYSEAPKTCVKDIINKRARLKQILDHEKTEPILQSSTPSSLTDPDEHHN